ncbi:MAG: glycosyltransferase family 39 protein [Bryobacterales bacterium]|nr:glycosyltransferase family 39 protein [Bryobacterales bacterium]
MNAGNMVSVDAKRRLQQSRSWWTSAPEVSADGFSGGYPGKDGIRRATFGMGHGLILMPADMAATAMLSAAGRLTPLSDHVAEGAREVLVAFFSQAFICSAAVLLAYLLLRRLGFPHAPSALGVLTLLLATTFLHYVQNCQETNLMLACALAGAHSIVLWLRSARPRDAALAGVAFGYAFLIRPTTLADTGGAMVFLFLALRWTPVRTGDALRRWLGFARSFLPVLAAFVFVERLYQHALFGAWLGTYWGSVSLLGFGAGRGIFAGNFWHGVGAALWFPDSSIFLFDPLLALSLALLAAFWKRIDPPVRALAIGALAALAVHICFHAKHFTPTGETGLGRPLHPDPGLPALPAGGASAVDRRERAAPARAGRRAGADCLERGAADRLRATDAGCGGKATPRLRVAVGHPATLCESVAGSGGPGGYFAAFPGPADGVAAHQPAPVPTRVALSGHCPMGARRLVSGAGCGVDAAGELAAPGAEPAECERQDASH